MRCCLKKTVEQRFWSHVGPHDDPNVCWLWLGTTAGGHVGRRYGWFRDDRMVYAHRFAYELLVGPIPEGYTIDHVEAKGCTNTLCVNPSHLEPVLHKENILRGNGPAAQNAKKTHCPQGHPYDVGNTYVYPYGRRCRICQGSGAG